MSKSIFADPKMALGFAGVTVALAVLASMGAGAFLPASDDYAEPQAPADAQVQAVRPQQTAPATTWVDEGLTDDWSAESAHSGTDWGNAPTSSNPNPEFEEYAPDNTVGPSPRGSSRSSQGPRVARTPREERVRESEFPTPIPPRSEVGEGIKMVSPPEI